MLNLWYKNSVFYNLDVETFQDSNGDGIGDFPGLTRRLGYLSGLGVTCLWLAPFYPTPNRDNGYDVQDYYSVDPRLGTLGEFVDFIHECREHGLRVIIDLVVNHTSIEHAWFQQAREDPDSPYFDFYVWSDEKPDDADEGIVFPGYQKSTWSYDRKAQKYYFHRFYKHQAELNIANPAVRDEIRRIMAFWLQLGVCGFRVDAAPFLIELKALDNIDVSEPYAYLKEFRDYLSWRQGDAILLAEANIDMAEVPKYFGDGEKLQMLFNFMLNQHVMLSLVRGEAAPIETGLAAPPNIPPSGQWVNFLRNHDELALGRITPAQRDEVYEAWAPDESMRIYGRGIRRRLPPMLGGDLRRLKLAHSLLFSLPGTPVLRYGEEIGMGEDLSLPERDSIRTPMQWSNEPNAGFSKATEDELIRPVVRTGKFSYKNLNVAHQQRDGQSLLTMTERLVRVRKECPEFGWGECTAVDTRNRSVFAHRCRWRDGVVLAFHNMGEKDEEISPDLSEHGDFRLNELVSDQSYEPLAAGAETVPISGYGFRWFRVVE